MTNPFFKNNYADINSVLDACKEALNDNGIAVLQPHDPVQPEEGTMVNFVETVLLHESGEFISGKTPILIKEKEKDNPQAMGSAVTYARRYGLQSLLGMNASDDDGNAGAGKSKPKASKSSTDKRTDAFKQSTPGGWD